MSTDSPQLPTDAQLLYEYLGNRIEQGHVDLPVADVVAELGNYGDQLNRLRAMIGEAEASLANGKAKPLDVEALLERLRRRIDATSEGRVE